MKEKIIHFTFCLFCILALVFIFDHNKEVAQVIINAGVLFFSKVFVSLFPMFILNDFMIGLHFPYYFYSIFKKTSQKIFHTSGISSYVFFLSIISGTPTNAYILKNLVDEKAITSLEASHYLYFTYFSNPLFLVTMLSLFFSKPIIIKIIFIHYFSNFLIGIFVRNKAPEISKSNLTYETKSIGTILSNSIKRTINTLLLVLGTIVFYMIVSFLFTSFIHIPIFKVLLSGFLEITNGLNLLSTVQISLKLKEIIAIGIISFGGLSIHTQVKSILEETDISYSNFFTGRIYQTLISIFLILIF